jgi:sugar lactone lactonase YvrE
MRSIRMLRALGVLLSLAALPAAAETTEAKTTEAKTTEAKTTEAKTVGHPLDVVKAFGDDFRLVGIGVSHEGRVFATAPASQVRSSASMVEVDPETGKVTPYPDAAWNRFDEQGDASKEWISVQALWVDKADHLWALDSSLTKLDQTRLPTKLVEFDLKSNKAVRQYGFAGVVAKPDALNDVRVDSDRGYAYLTNAANRGGLVVLNLKTGESRQVLVDDRSTFADPQQHLMINGQPALTPDGSVLVLHADGIELSPDGNWLYYRPLTDHNYWRVPTAALRDARLTPEALAKKVEFLGTSVMSGGLIMDRHGTLYGGDLEHSTVAAITVKPGGHGLVTRTYAADPEKLSWADGFAISGNDLYIADSRLWEVAFKNNLPRGGPFRILKVKLQ